MGPVEYVGLRCDKLTEIIISIIAGFTWVLMFVFCPLVNTWKMCQKDRIEFPISVIVALQCHAEFSIIYALHVMQKPFPFHYGCLMYVSSFMSNVGMLYMRTIGPNVSAWVIVVVSTTLMSVLIFFLNSDDVMKYVRVASIVLGIFAYASPLPIVIQASREKTVPCLPIYLSSVFFLNGLAWLIVSLLPLTFDPYLMITNGVGAILALSQLGVLLRSKLIIKVYPLDSA